MLKKLGLGVVLLSLLAIPTSAAAGEWIIQLEYPYWIWIAGHWVVSDDGRHMVIDCDGSGDYWCIVVPDIGICSSGVAGLEGYQDEDTNYYYFKGTETDTIVVNDNDGTSQMEILKDILDTAADSLTTGMGYCN